MPPARTPPPGHGRVTLAEVAERAGVSVMTASYTYNQPARVSEQSRARVLAAAAELGYAGPDPRARALRRGRAQALGVVLGEHLTYAFDDPGAVSFLAGVADVCAARGLGVTIVPTTGAAEDAQRVTEAAVDGFVVWTTADDDPVLAAARATRRPVAVHGGPRLPGVPVVTIDNRAAARAVGEVAFAEARRPAVVSQPLTPARRAEIRHGIDPAEATFPVTRDRLAGYRDAARALEIPWDSVLVVVCARNEAVEAERLAGSVLTAPDPPDAVAAMSDQQALGVLGAARSLGRRVPEELAVTGFDDLPAAAGAGLTTVAQSLREQGAVCARIAAGERRRSVMATWSVVVRSSTRE